MDKRERRTDDVGRGNGLGIGNLKTPSLKITGCPEKLDRLFPFILFFICFFYALRLERSFYAVWFFFVINTFFLLLNHK